jgi:hypothetical protein
LQTVFFLLCYVPQMYETSIVVIHPLIVNAECRFAKGASDFGKIPSDSQVTFANFTQHDDLLVKSVVHLNHYRISRLGKEVYKVQ